MRSFGPRDTIDPSRDPSVIAATFSQHMAVLRSHFYRIRISSGACYFRAPSVAILTSLHPAVNLLVLLWKTRSRPSRVRVCPAARFDFSALQLTRVHEQWLFFVRMIRDVSPNKIYLRTKVQMRPALHHRQNLLSLMILMFLFVQGLRVPAQGGHCSCVICQEVACCFCDNSFVAPACV